MFVCRFITAQYKWKETVPSRDMHLRTGLLLVSVSVIKLLTFNMFLCTGLLLELLCIFICVFVQLYFRSATEITILHEICRCEGRLM